MTESRASFYYFRRLRRRNARSVKLGYQWVAKIKVDKTSQPIRRSALSSRAIHSIIPSGNVFRQAETLRKHRRTVSRRKSMHRKDKIVFTEPIPVKKPSLPTAGTRRERAILKILTFNDSITWYNSSSPYTSQFTTRVTLLRCPPFYWVDHEIARGLELNYIITARALLGLPELRKPQSVLNKMLARATRIRRWLNQLKGEKRFPKFIKKSRREFGVLPATTASEPGKQSVAEKVSKEEVDQLWQAGLSQDTLGALFPEFYPR